MFYHCVLLSVESAVGRDLSLRLKRNHRKREFRARQQQAESLDTAQQVVARDRAHATQRLASEMESMPCALPVKDGLGVGGI